MRDPIDSCARSRRRKPYGVFPFGFLAEVIESIQTTLNTSGAAVAVRGELESEMVPVVTSGFSDGFEASFRLEDDDPLVRLVQRSRKAVLFEDIEMESDPRFAS